MNRRGFLKAFTQAAVGLAVAPALARVAPSVVPVSVPEALPVSPTITYLNLEAGYLAALQGKMQPNIMIVSKQMYRAIVAAVERDEWPEEDVEESGLRVRGTTYGEVER